MLLFIISYGGEDVDDGEEEEEEEEGRGVGAAAIVVAAEASLIDKTNADLFTSVLSESAYVNSDSGQTCPPVYLLLHSLRSHPSH